MPELTRRSALLGGAAAVAASTTLPGVLAPGTAVAQAPQDDPAKIIAAYRYLQVGAGRTSPERTRAVQALDEVAVAYHAAMDTGSDQLWPDLPVGPGSTYFQKMYYRLRTIAVDWATPGSALSGKPGLPQRIHTALETLYRVQYNEHTDELGNWYSYEIGTPLWLVQTLASTMDIIPAADRERYLRPVLRFIADPNRRTNNPNVVETGANRADKATLTVVSGAMMADPARIRLGVEAVTDVAGGGAASLIAKVTAGDGFHTDGSFLQHEVVPYPGHYALVLVQAVAGLMEVTRGTAWELPEDVRRAMCATVPDSLAPFMFDGAMMEPVRGRFLSRQGETGHDAGHQLTSATALLARNAPEPERAQLTGLVAAWIQRGKWAPYLEVTDVGRFSGGLQPVGVPEVEYAQELLAANPVPAPVVPQHRVFGQQERMLHVTPAWSASLGVSSTRICRYEAINSMNLRGWYTGDGVLYVFQPGAEGHYSDAYWPTVDATLLPGTTAKDSAPPKLEQIPLSSKPFSGGVRFDAQHGAYGVDFVSQDGTLTAKKSWFFTPEGVVCLGAGITDASGAKVRTTVENRGLGTNPRNALRADGRLLPVELGKSTSLRKPRWVHLDGVGGYVLLSDVDVSVLREDRTGAWADVDKGANTGGTTTPYTRRYQKVVIEHGANPSGASYGYVVLPGASAAATAASALSWRVRSNTAEVQAIRLWEGTLLANFFTGGTIDDLTVSGPASIAVERVRDGWQVAVADPTHLQQSIRVTILRKSVDVDVSGAQGATRTVKIGR
ncbi:polysaccharide lyase 8 family protein [Amycolatopsis magusensis]|uniref:polysaccharide lyase 8 family protein n=1 Tax=Amycolatopsis magusensis TaxID=882444 RepID=UPI0024A7D861|nr:polysaccharide lyase 8 family protein [Amycolatopsis magusensis]MDI5978948.1 polysaccharide lyase 8 family protein [Amycolatopsis magusensis]